MKWNTTAHSSHIGLRRTKYLMGPLYRHGYFLAVLDGYGTEQVALDYCCTHLPMIAARANAKTAEEGMYDLFAMLSAGTNYCSDGVRLSVAYVFDSGVVTVGSLGDTRIVYGQRDDMGKIKLIANTPHIPALNVDEYNRLMGAGYNPTEVLPRSTLGTVAPVSGFLGDWQISEVATRVPEVHTFRDVEPGDFVALTTSALHDLPEFVQDTQWQRFFAKRGCAEKMFRYFRDHLAKNREDVSIALAYAIPG